MCFSYPTYTHACATLVVMLPCDHHCALCRFKAYGATDHTTASHIENDADVYRLFSRLVFEYRGRVKVLQTPTILHTCSTILMLGLLVQSRYSEAPLRTISCDDGSNPTDTRKLFCNTLVQKGIPKNVATQVVRRFRSYDVLENAYVVLCISSPIMTLD